MKEYGLQAPHRVRPSREHAHDGTIVTERVDDVWDEPSSRHRSEADGE
jgi:putative transposase